MTAASGFPAPKPTSQVHNGCNDACRRGLVILRLSLAARLTIAHFKTTNHHLDPRVVRQE